MTDGLAIDALFEAVSSASTTDSPDEREAARERFGEALDAGATIDELRAMANTHYFAKRARARRLLDAFAREHDPTIQ